MEKLLLWRAGCRQSEQGELAEQTTLAEHKAERKREIAEHNEKLIKTSEQTLDRLILYLTSLS